MHLPGYDVVAMVKVAFPWWTQGCAKLAPGKAAGSDRRLCGALFTSGMLVRR